MEEFGRGSAAGSAWAALLTVEGTAGRGVAVAPSCGTTVGQAWPGWRHTPSPTLPPRGRGQAGARHQRSRRSMTGSKPALAHSTPAEWSTTPERRPSNTLDCAKCPRLDARMRSLVIAVAFVLLTVSSARADAPRAPAIPKPRAQDSQPPSSTALPRDVQDVRERWVRCTSAAAKAHIGGRRPAAIVAELALQRCKAQEQALARVLRRQLGAAGADRTLDLVRETDRANLIRVIEELRRSQ